MGSRVYGTADYSKSLHRRGVQFLDVALINRQNNYAVILYTGLGMTSYLPLLLAAVWTLTGKLCPCEKQAIEIEILIIL